MFNYKEVPLQLLILCSAGDGDLDCEAIALDTQQFFHLSLGTK